MICMSHLLRIKIYFGLKVRIKQPLYFFILINILLWSCASKNNYHLAELDPERFILLKDSLLSINRHDDVISAFTGAHNSIGEKAILDKDYKTAIKQFSLALELSPTDSTSRYNLYMAEGHSIYNSSKRKKLWDAIDKYDSASRIKPKSGEPHYYIGETYLKISDRDFDLIIESYDRALSLQLDPLLKIIVLERKKHEQERQNKYEKFWR